MELPKNTSNDSNGRIEYALLKAVYKRAVVGITATVVNSFILFMALKGVVPHTALTLWFSTILFFALIRLVFTIKIRRHPDRTIDVRRSKRLLIIWILCAGILWGLVSVVLFPSHSVMHQALIAFVLAGMVAGAVGVFSSFMSVFLSFSIPALTPIFIRFIIIGDGLHMTMAAMTLLFGVLTFLTAKYLNRETRELVLLKETFSKELEIRTEELSATNKKLEQEMERRAETGKALLEERDKLQRMISEIKILKGFIPICSSCNKIRDDEGYWQRLERYIQEHSEAKFSHGICPDCFEKLYPEYDPEA